MEIKLEGKESTEIMWIPLKVVELWKCVIQAYNPILPTFLLAV